MQTLIPDNAPLSLSGMTGFNHLILMLFSDLQLTLLVTFSAFQLTRRIRHSRTKERGIWNLQQHTETPNHFPRHYRNDTRPHQKRKRLHRSEAFIDTCCCLLIQLDAGKFQILGRRIRFREPQTQGYHCRVLSCNAC